MQPPPQQHVIQGGSQGLSIPELWEYRELLYFFAWRDIKVRYRQAALGVAWAVIQPLGMMLVLSGFFGGILKVKSDQLPYPIFVCSGLMLWSLFAGGVTGAASSLVSHAHIITKVYFPRLVLPLSALLVALFDFAIVLVAFCILLVAYGVTPSPATLFARMSVALILTLLVTGALGTLLAAINLLYRDVRHVLPFIVQILFFVTPVIYPLSLVENRWWGGLLVMNPMCGAVALAHSALSDGPAPWRAVTVGLIVSLASIGVAGYVFGRAQAQFGDRA